VESPGAYVSGTVALVANANSTNGITKVSLQRAPRGSSSFTEICADTTSPYGCTWVTTSLTDGGYDLRAVMTDAKGLVTTSSPVVQVTVDNSPLRAQDVQAVNKGAVVGKIEAGDQLVLTYTGVVSPTSLVAGWDGSDKAVTARVKDGLLVTGGTSSTDMLSVDGVNLGEVNLNGDYVKKRKTVTYASTLRASTTTVNGTTTTVVTLTLGTPSMSGNTTPAAGAMVWTPSSAAKNLSGQACSVTPATESGAADKDF
jgi:chitinase